MSELRQNLATKEWVVISTERGKKPNAVLNKIIGTPVSDKDYDPECPFCPGNESRYPLQSRLFAFHYRAVVKDRFVLTSLSDSYVAPMKVYYSGSAIYVKLPLRSD